jgi:hypothetical protein
MKEIAAAFVKAQAGFQKALKTTANPFYKNKYADLATCLSAVIDSLNSNGIALMQLTHKEKEEVHVETVLLHTSGEMLSGGHLVMPAVKYDPQGFGSALTYARRYSLMACLGIASEDDDGQAATNSQKPRLAVEHLQASIEGAQTEAELEVIWKNALGVIGAKGGPEYNRVKNLTTLRVNAIRQANAADT